MKKIAYQRQGKFGTEFLVSIRNLPVIPSRETEKAICCGQYESGYYKDGSRKTTIFGFIPKSQITVINNEQFIPTWLIDKWNCNHLQFTHSIKSDYYHKEWDIRGFGMTVAEALQIAIDNALDPKTKQIYRDCRDNMTIDQCKLMLDVEDAQMWREIHARVI